jgi:hypothetical protein
MLKALIEKFTPKERYAEIYLRTFNRETREEDVYERDAVRWIESNVPGAICNVVRETVTNSRGVTYSAPIVRILMRYRTRRELKKAVESIKTEFNRKKLIVVFK